MKIALVLTNDWELFGDGSGDYFDLQHCLLDEYLSISSDYGVNISLMVEVLQQIYHRKFVNANPEFEKIANSWDEIVLKTIEKGSDAQLHLHPQWLGAKYENGKWHLNMKRTSIGQLPIEESESIIKEGKEYLESLIKPKFPNYKCNIFRAGAYCIEPSSSIIPTLKKYGIIADTSVTKGLANEGFFDFSDAESNWKAWRTNPHSVIQAGVGGVIELPIYSVNTLDSQVLRKFFPKFYYTAKFGINVPDDEMNWLSEKEEIKEKRYPRANRYYKANKKKDLNFYLSAISGINNIQLDYDYLPATIFVRLLEKLYKQLENSKLYDSEYVPIVASGHLKDIHNLNNLKKIFKLLNEKMRNRIEFWTISRAVELINSKI